MILQFFKCCKTKPLYVWSLPPCETKLLSKNFVLPCIPITKSSHRRCPKNVIKNLENFKQEHLCWSLFLIKYQAWSLSLYLKRLQRRSFLVKFSKILRTPIVKNICVQLLLSASENLVHWLYKENRRSTVNDTTEQQILFIPIMNLIKLVRAIFTLY